jgi:hypothetical protein
LLHFAFNSCGRRLLSGRGDAGEHGLGIAHRALGRFAAEFLIPPRLALPDSAVLPVFTRRRRGRLTRMSLSLRALSPTRLGAHRARRSRLSGCALWALARPSAASAAASSPARSLASLRARLGTRFWTSGLLGHALAGWLFVLLLGRLTGGRPMSLGASLRVALPAPPS